MAMSDSPTADGSGHMFDRVAQRYDLLNRLLSLGMDGLWRRALVEALDEGALERPQVLAVATGTADVAIAVARRFPAATVGGLDPSVGMLQVGRPKLEREGLQGRVSLIEGDAQAMPFESDRFDASCIAFGIRNVPDRDAGLREMARCTRPGGRVVVLELGEPRQGWLSPLARLHVRHVVPRLGAWLSGDDEYAYLQRSIAAFPAPDAFAEQMRSAGLEMVGLRPFAFGAATLYVAAVT